MHWYLVHTKPREESRALTNLERQGYTCYLPSWRVERVRRGRVKVCTEPLFPRYLFISLDSSGQGQSWAPIRSTLGVVGLVRFGAQLAKVDEALVAALREREQQAPVAARFQAGATVVVTAGPFAGVEAIYQTADSQRRALILLEILNKPVTMSIESSLLTPTEN